MRKLVWSLSLLEKMSADFFFPLALAEARGVVAAWPSSPGWALRAAKAPARGGLELGGAK